MQKFTNLINEIYSDREGNNEMWAILGFLAPLMLGIFIGLILA